MDALKTFRADNTIQKKVATDGYLSFRDFMPCRLVTVMLWLEGSFRIDANILGLFGRQFFEFYA